MYQAQKQTKDLRKVLAGVLVAFILFTGVILAVVVAGNEASKETHADGPVLVSLQGEPIQVAPVESFSSLWDMILLSTTTLAKLTRVTFVYNMPSPNDPQVMRRVEGSFVVDGFYRPIDAETDEPLAAQLVLMTKQGYAGIP
jgi:low affinity Fe/Cu permease